MYKSLVGGKTLWLRHVYPDSLVVKKRLRCRSLTMKLCSKSVFLFQPIPDREGKRCMFCVKTHNKTYEMSASDQRQKVEWTQGVLVCISRNRAAVDEKQNHKLFCVVLILYCKVVVIN